MRFFDVLKTVVLAIGLATGVAHASTVDFEVGAGTTATAATTLGVGNISADASGAIGTAFTLAEGETSSWFNFFSLTAIPNRWGAAAGTYSVAANLEFSAPGGSVSGSGSGMFFTLSGVVSGGTLSWSDAIQSVALADGTAFTVQLRQGLTIVPGDTAYVQARVTLDLAPAPVPLPASALLLLAGIGGFGVLRLRRKQDVAA